MDAKTSTKATVLLCLGTVFTILAQVILYKLQDRNRLVIICGITGYSLMEFLAFGTLFCIGGLLAVFINAKDTGGKPRRAYKAVIFTLGIIVLELPAIFNFLMMFLCSARVPSDPEKIKSPDGKHFIVRTSDTAEGHSIYCYYIKDYGIIYRPIFEDFERKSDPELQWTDEGVIYEGKLYEY
ncbi:MAG: hypothetical protein IJU93_00060 [Lachnospiraceae bacterium]|nr:hypothetical protein [Ruminococcus sp.]MBQ9503383.1 hypothetical protein [Lachnospiraceae bacterium]